MISPLDLAHFWNALRGALGFATPLLVFATGVGLAAVLHDLRRRSAKTPFWLFLGVKDWEAAGPHRAELLDLLKSRVIHRLDVAIERPRSRSRGAYGLHLHQKTGLLNLLEPLQKDLLGWIDRGARIYSYGGRGLDRQLEGELEKLLASSGRAADEAAAKAQLAHWKAKHRLRLVGLTPTSQEFSTKRSPAERPTR